MASTKRFVKIVCFYVFCTVLLIDIYIFVAKPQLLKTIFSTDKQFSLVDYAESGRPPDLAQGLQYQRCLYKPNHEQFCTGAGYTGVKIKSQSYTRFIQQSILKVFVLLWEGIFAALEEIEHLSIGIVHGSVSIWKELSTLHKATSTSNLDQRKTHPVLRSELTTPEQHQHGVLIDAMESQQGTFALSARIQRSILSKNVRIHRPTSEENFINMTYLNLTRRLDLSIDLVREANNTLRLAKEFLRHGNLAKAKKLLEHARLLNPYDADAMASYGEVFEQHRPPDYVKAEHYYGKALLADPTNEKAKASRQRTLPLVEQIDQARFNRIDQKVYQYYHIPETHPGLRRLKKEHYFRYVYHTNAIEGNTLSLAQTRAILETRIAVGGKSLIEQNEVLGLDAALKFLNSSLLRKPGPLLLADLLEIHRRVLGYVDLQEAGRLRNTQVYIADFEPPPASLVPSLMADFLAWLNSEDTQDLHPVERAALAHWKLVYIHPFYDGNGRTARLLMNLILMQSGYPPAIVRVEERALYYQLIREANEGDVRPFIRFIGHCTEATIDEFLLTAKQVTKFDAENAETLSSSLAKQALSDSDCKPRVINL